MRTSTSPGAIGPTSTVSIAIGVPVCRNTAARAWSMAAPPRSPHSTGTGAAKRTSPIVCAQRPRDNVIRRKRRTKNRGMIRAMHDPVSPIIPPRSCQQHGVKGPQRPKRKGAPPPKRFSPLLAEAGKLGGFHHQSCLACGATSPSRMSASYAHLTPALQMKLRPDWRRSGPRPTISNGG